MIKDELMSKHQIKIDRNIIVPLYEQLLSQIEKKIRNGEYPKGSPLPSMNSLAAELDISKETVKKVYLILKQRNDIESRQGKGFYVK